MKRIIVNTGLAMLALASAVALVVGLSPFSLPPVTGQRLACPFLLTAGAAAPRLSARPWQLNVSDQEEKAPQVRVEARGAAGCDLVITRAARPDYGGTDWRIGVAFTRQEIPAGAGHALFAAEIEADAALAFPAGSFYGYAGKDVLSVPLGNVGPAPRRIELAMPLSPDQDFQEFWIRLGIHGPVPAGRLKLRQLSIRFLPGPAPAG